MKFFWVTALFLLFSAGTFAQNGDQPQQHELATIKSIDDFDLPFSYDEASEETLPSDELLKILRRDDFTVVPESRVWQIFRKLEKDPRARNRIAGGKCAIRRAYIQGYLRRLSISSGRLLINCPGNIGHMRLRDKVTGHRYTFANFHDVNILAVPGGYNVMDVQFEDEPNSLSAYLAVVEASQKLKPLRNRARGDRGYCYWSIR